jgi:radical SAM protein with 4Fe4S-binding SPASM domain
MSKEDCLRIISEAAILGVTNMTFSGGEPFLWHSLPDAVSLASSNKMDVSVYTTGNTESYDTLVPELRMKGLKHLVFSLFGADARTHEKITRKSGSFNKTIDAIRYAKSQKIDAQIHFVPTKRNYFVLDQVVAIAESLNVSAVSILRLVPQGRASLLSNDVLSKIQNVELRNQIIQIRKQNRVKIRTGSPYNFLLLNENSPCDAANNRIIISPDLYVFPCDAFKGLHAEDIVGTDSLSLLSQTSLSECWLMSSYLNAVRNSIQSELNEQCGSCKNTKLCRSGCLAQKVLKSGLLVSQPDPDCLAERIENTDENAF